MNNSFSKFTFEKMYKYKWQVFKTGLLDASLQNIPLLEGIILKYFFDYLANPNDSTFSPFYSCLYLIVLYIFIILIRKVYFHFKTHLDFKLSCDIKKDATISFLRKFQYDSFEGAGRLINSLNDDVEQIVVYIGWLITVFCQLIRVLIVVAILCTINIKMMIMLIVPISLVEIIAHLLGNKVATKRKTLRRKVGNVNSFLINIIQSAIPLKVLNNYNGIFKKYSDLCKDREKAAISDSFLSTVINNIYNNMGNFCIIMSMLAFSGLFGQSDFNIGNFTLFITYSYYVTDSLESLGNLLVFKKQTIVSYENISQLFLFNNPDLKINDDKIDFDKILINHVSYKEKDIQFSTGTLEIVNGDKILIRSEAKGGKTTLLNCLLGLFNSEIEMAYFLDNKKINIQNLADLNVSFISQNPSFFSGSVLSNLVFEDRYDKNKIEEILNQMRLGEEIYLNQEIGVNGSKLSGGQQQRFAIVRALIQNNNIIVIDDSTTALDNDTFYSIWNELLKNKTLTIIAASNDIRLTNIFQKVITIN